MTDEGPRPWFRAKRYGYGSGLPIAWQGWAVLAGYVLVNVLLAVFLIPRAWPLLVAVVAISTALLLKIAPGRTRGGWRWRWGDEP